MSTGWRTLLLSMSHEQFARLMRDARHGEFCRAMAH
jgi:hypothetical protein